MIRYAILKQFHLTYWIFLLCSLHLIAGCQPDTPEFDYVFESAKHYDAVSDGDTLDLAWTFTPNEKIMNPVVVDGQRTIYFQTHEAVYAVDPSDGSLFWRHPVDDPTLDSTQVFIVPFEDVLLIPTQRERVLQGVDADSGEVLWDLPFYNHVSALSGRPQLVDLVVDDERAYALISLNRGTALWAIDPHTGEILWEAPDDLEDGLPGAIFQDIEKDYLHVYNRSFWELDKESGRIMDHFDIDMSSTRRPTYADGVAYTSGSTTKAIDLKVPKEAWSFDPDLCDKKSLRSVFTPPILYDTFGYLLTSCGYLLQVDLNSGEILWQVEVPPRPKSLTAVGESVFVMALDGRISLVDPATGETRSALMLSPPTINSVTHKHLAATDELLILTPGNNQAFAFRLK